MGNIIKHCCVIAVAASLTFTGCPADKTVDSDEQENGGRLDIWVGSALYTGGIRAVYEEGEITVIVENFYAAATEELSVTVDDQGAGSFSVTPAAIGPIEAGDFDWFTITVEGANNGDSAAITISGTDISITIQIQYTDETEEIESLNEADFHGKFSQSGGSPRIMTISHESFRFEFPNGGTPAGSEPTDVTSIILGWKEVQWTVQANNNNASAIPVGETVSAWEIECEVEVYVSHLNGDQINDFFGVPRGSTSIDVGHKFTVWLLCKDPAAVSSTGKIFVGYINNGNNRAAPWAEFTRQP